MSNVLSQEKKQQILSLGQLGWTLRRIQEATGVRRETAAAYLKAAGVAIRPPGAWGRRPPARPANEVTPDSGPAAAPENEPAVTTNSKPANEVTPGSGVHSEPTHSPTASACEPHRDFIELSLSKGRNAKAIYQDLVDDHGFRASYQSVKRFAGKLRDSAASDACSVIVTPPGEELQVDYGTGAMVRDPHTGRYRRTRMFVLTLGYSRKAVHLLTFTSSTQTWVELHQQSLRRLGGATRTVVLDFVPGNKIEVLWRTPLCGGY